MRSLRERKGRRMNEREKKLVYWKWWADLLERMLERGVHRRIRRRRVADLRHAKFVIRGLESGIIVCVLLLILVGGCSNTFNGFGNFISGVGEDISQAAKNTEVRE